MSREWYWWSITEQGSSKVKLPTRSKESNDILAIHDRIIPRNYPENKHCRIKRMRDSGSTKKIGENEKNLHNRLQKPETLYNDLAKEVIVVAAAAVNNGTTG